MAFVIDGATASGARRTKHTRERSSFDGAIFDIDGVLVDSPHEPAWRETLRELMETSWADIRPQTTWAPERFTSRVYQEFVAGKPRMSGARAALGYFGLPDDNELVEEYAERKQRMVVGLIEAGQFTAFPDALRLLLAVRAAGIRVAAASSSKNTGLMLSRVRLDTLANEHHLELDLIQPGRTLLDVIDVDISGRSFKQGKPHPEIFLSASRELGVPAQACFVARGRCLRDHRGQGRRDGGPRHRPSPRFAALERRRRRPGGDNARRRGSRISPAGAPDARASECLRARSGRVRAGRLQLRDTSWR